MTVKAHCTGQLKHVWFWHGTGSELYQLRCFWGYYGNSKGSRMNSLFHKDQAIRCFYQSLKFAYHTESFARKNSPISPKTRCDIKKKAKFLHVYAWMQNICYGLCHWKQHVLVFKGKQKEISVVHLQTRLSARNNASREAQKEPTGQATSYFLSKALSATKKAKLIMLSAHILQAWCNAPRA